MKKAKCIGCGFEVLGIVGHKFVATMVCPCCLKKKWVVSK